MTGAELKKLNEQYKQRKEKEAREKAHKEFVENAKLLAKEMHEKVVTKKEAAKAKNGGKKMREFLVVGEENEKILEEEKPVEEELPCEEPQEELHEELSAEEPAVREEE